MGASSFNIVVSEFVCSWFEKISSDLPQLTSHPTNLFFGKIMYTEKGIEVVKVPLDMQEAGYQQVLKYICTGIKF